MTELISALKYKEEVEQICKNNSLNISMLKNLFTLAARGFNNTELAQKLGVHRVTIQRYSQTLRNMKQEEYNLLFNYVIRGKL